MFSSLLCKNRFSNNNTIKIYMNESIKKYMNDSTNKYLNKDKKKSPPLKQNKNNYKISSKIKKSRCNGLVNFKPSDYNSQNKLSKFLHKSYLTLYRNF